MYSALVSSTTNKTSWFHYRCGWKTKTEWSTRGGRITSNKVFRSSIKAWTRSCRSRLKIKKDGSRATKSCNNTCWRSTPFYTPWTATQLHQNAAWRHDQGDPVQHQAISIVTLDKGDLGTGPHQPLWKERQSALLDESQQAHDASRSSEQVRGSNSMFWVRRAAGSQLIRWKCHLAAAERSILNNVKEKVKSNDISYHLHTLSKFRLSNSRVLVNKRFVSPFL